MGAIADLPPLPHLHCGIPTSLGKNFRTKRLPSAPEPPVEVLSSPKQEGCK